MAGNKRREEFPGQRILVVEDEDLVRAVAARAKLTFPDMPVVYISGRSDRLTNKIEDRDVFVKKPFDLNSLMAIVGGLVSDA